VTERIGFIGVGAMGSAIAGRLLNAYDVVVNDKNPAAVERLAGRGATAGTLEQIADSCAVIFLSLPRPTDVVELLFGPELDGRLPRGTVIIDTTTGTPSVDKDIVERLGDAGVDFVDSPIGGGVRRAEAGTATLMVGATDAVFERVRPILETVTSEVLFVGPPGAGHTAKLVNNLLNTCNRFAAMEAIRLGDLGGIKREVMLDVINKGSARNYATEYTYPQLLTPTDDEPYKLQGFTLQLMHKDVRLANELAEDLGHDTAIGHLVQGFAEQAIERFGANADQSQMMVEWYDA
jgi:3-hydroxyisobutyrate dehydrogenase